MIVVKFTSVRSKGGKNLIDVKSEGKGDINQKQQDLPVFSSDKFEENKILKDVEKLYKVEIVNSYSQKKMLSIFKNTL